MLVQEKVKYNSFVDILSSIFMNNHFSVQQVVYHPVSSSNKVRTNCFTWIRRYLKTETSTGARRKLFLREGGR